MTLHGSPLSGSSRRGRVALAALVVASAFEGLAAAATISGTVFEDVNYGGGAGRSLATSAGAPVSGARVEIYDAGGNYLTNLTTNASGQYTYTYTGNQARTVRVVSGTVRSTRTGGSACTTCVPVQTFRTTGSGNTAVGVTDRVGGETPAISDAASNTSSTALAALTTATQTAQSIATFDPTTNGTTISGADFGFNFSTIVNPRDAASCAPSGSGSSFFPCQGSLRQFIINANALGGEGSLSQAGQRQLDGSTSSLPAGFDTSVFMIADGTATPGHNIAHANLLTAGVAQITLASAITALSSPSTRLDATTQTINVGNTNSGTLGTGGTVGVDAVALPLFQRPEVQINFGSTNAQLNISGSSSAIHGFALRQGYILLSGTSSTARNNLVGMSATGVSSDAGGTFYGITFSATGTIVDNNFVTVGNSGIRTDGGATNSIVRFNEVARPANGHSTTYDGILLINGAVGIQVTSNLVRNQLGGGIELGFGAPTDVYSNVTVSNNTVRNNGFTSGTTASTEPLGLVSYNYTGSNVVYYRNLVIDNAGPGLLVIGANGTRASENRFSNNGALAIELDPVTRDPNGYGTAQGVTLNDANDADTGPNGLLNFPVIASAMAFNGELTIQGFARPGSVIELYVAQADPTGFGEGFTYVTVFTEGSGSDLLATTGTYGPATINGLSQGTDTTNRFAFRIPLPSGVAVGTTLTATATLSGQTSEFSGNVVVTGGPGLVNRKTVAVVSDPYNIATNPKSIPGSEQDYTIRVTNQGTGTVDASTITIVDPVPANTKLFVGNLGAPGSGPVSFANGTPSSGLTFTFTALNSATDDVEFSNDGGTTWTYVPTPDADGCDAAVTTLRVLPKGTMAGSTIAGNPFFDLRYRVRVN